MFHIRFAIVLFTVISYNYGQIYPPGDVIKHNKKDTPIDNTEEHSEHEQPNKGKHFVVQLPKSNNDKQESKLVPNILSKNATNNNSTTAKSITQQTGNTNVDNNSKIKETLEANTTESLESGALTRGVLVFMGIGLLFILYVGFKTYRRKKEDKSRTVVRKYGVRTTRSDIEMEPLPLSDDDEDETLFDLSASRNINR